MKLNQANITTGPTITSALLLWLLAFVSTATLAEEPASRSNRSISKQTDFEKLHAIEKLKVPARLTAGQFADYQKLIKPAADESPWAKISWHASVWEARKQAAAEGKPILIWAGGGSPPLGVC